MNIIVLYLKRILNFINKILSIKYDFTELNSDLSYKVLEAKDVGQLIWKFSFWHYFLDITIYKQVAFLETKLFDLTVHKTLDCFVLYLYYKEFVYEIIVQHFIFDRIKRLYRYYLNVKQTKTTNNVKH